MSLPATVSHAIQQTQEWLKQVRDYADLADEEHAYSVLRAVLHQLRDRLTLEEAFDLGAQLPTLVRGIYFEGYQPGRRHERIRSKERLLEDLAARLQPHRIPPRDGRSSSLRDPGVSLRSWRDCGCRRSASP